MVIDAHHHLWKYDAAEYGWIDGEMAALRRDFLPADLEAVLRTAGVDGAVTVQARQTLEETRWLLELAAAHPIMRGVVGWVPLVAPDVRRHLETFADNPKLRGVRHVLQGEPESYMQRADFNTGIDVLKGFGLCYDVLVFERQLAAAIELVDRHPEQRFVLDHVAKPRIKAGDLEPWATRIRELAKRPQVTCKISGMVTEADWTAWTPETLRMYVEVVLAAFGPERLMFGSDWPVCLVASSYGRWVEQVRKWIGGLSAHEQSRIMGGTAVEVYGLE